MTWKSKITFIIILKIILPGRVCNNEKEPRTFFFIIKAVNFFNECPCICSISNFFRVISTSANIRPNRNMRLNSSTWKPSHFKAVFQLVPDSMLKFSLPYQSGLSYDNFYWFQIFYVYIYIRYILHE